MVLEDLLGILIANILDFSGVNSSGRDGKFWITSDLQTTRRHAKVRPCFADRCATISGKRFTFRGQELPLKVFIV